MITFESKGSFVNTDNFLSAMSKKDIFASLEYYGELGVMALASATPIDSDLTANSWTYEVKRDGKSYSIIWSNTNVHNGEVVAVLLQYGHATGTGGYVQGRDYINPALKPIFDNIEAEVWKVVTTS
jgi:hypothetical protein